MYAPLSLNVTVTLTFDLDSPRGHLLVMTNHHTKLGDLQALSSFVIDRTRFVYGPTFAKQYTPSSSKWGITVFKIIHLNTLIQCHQFCIYFTSFDKTFQSCKYLLHVHDADYRMKYNIEQMVRHWFQFTQHIVKPECQNT